MPGRISKERWDRADTLLRDGQSLHEVSRQTGISRPSLKKRREGSTTTATEPNGQTTIVPPTPEPPRDPPPQPRRRARKPVAPDNEQLESMCRKIAKAPAVPAQLMLRCNYCATHFLTTAPEVARELVAFSEEDPELRKMLEGLYVNWRRYAWAGLIASWAGVPMLHHLAPGFVYGAVAPLVGMPPREPARHAHPPPAAAPANGAGAPAPDVPTPGPFAGMDLDTLLSQARDMGINLADFGIDESILTGANAAIPDPEVSPDSDTAAETDAPAEATTADPDPEL